MSMILDGKALANSLENDYKKEVLELKRKPSLVVLLVGSHPPSQSYVRAKKRACQRVGIAVEIKEFAEIISEEKLCQEIDRLNRANEVDGILIQLPLPPHIDALKVVARLDPNKDIDGFHPENMGKLLLGRDDGFIPCTPLGIQKLLQSASLPIESAHVVIVGRSQVVGRPLAALLMQNRKGCNATVTVAHSHTTKLSELTARADIVVAAIGKRGFIRPEMVKEGAIVIDVGINRTETGHLVGDVDFDAVRPKCRAITPVPGGVGPMTVSMLMHNVILSAKRREHDRAT